MTWKTAVLGLLCATATLGVGAGASAGGSRAAAAPPRVRAFSPAAVHPGDEFLIDADFDGARAPRVWVGRRAIPRSRVRIAHDLAPSGARRLWARVPKRFVAGEHVIKIATRAGAAVAAKPIEVASCYVEPVASGGCDEVPGLSVKLTLSGFSDPIEVANSVTMSTEPSDATKSYLSVCGDDGKFRCLSMQMTTQDRAEMHVGTVPTLGLQFYDGKTGNQWTKEPGGPVKVVEATPTRVLLCFDTVLTAIGGSIVPKTVKVKGYVVISR